jgi:hypothetical protein
MGISPQARASTQSDAARWLLLVFSLPAKSASQRVGVWRKLRRYGVLPLKSSGYVLPNTTVNEERLQWLASDIRKHKGEASVLQVTAIDNLPSPQLVRMFIQARTIEYEAIAKELNKLARGQSRPVGAVARLRRRFQEVAGRDFFQPPARARLIEVFAKMDATEHVASASTGHKRKDYQGKTWLTRPRPGIDRVSSAWLIRRFIDPNATFAFAEDPASVPGAIPFDMFGGAGFGHRGDDCTFETLVKQFAIGDERVRAIALAVHDADLADEKFGSSDAMGLDRVLSGWANQGISDDELLRRGTELIEGLYQAQ